MRQCSECAHFSRRAGLSRYGWCNKNVIETSAGKMRRPVRVDQYCEHYRKSIAAKLRGVVKFFRG